MRTRGPAWRQRSPITRLDWETIRGKPKNEASTRVIALDADTAAILRAHRS